MWHCVTVHHWHSAEMEGVLRTDNMSDHSFCETHLSRVAIFDASVQCSWMPNICQINLLARPSACLRFLQLDLEALCSELLT
jgi:hypothetical protein